MIGDGCDELQHSTRLRQLLGIVLQFGNRLNTAGKSKERKAGAFTLDSLLKLSQAKAFDKKTTFLHYVVMIVHRNNETLLNFTDDLPNVMKADKVYWDQCLQDLEGVESQLENVRRISLHEARVKKQQYNNNHGDDESLSDVELTLEEEVECLRSTPTGLFTLSAIKQVSALRDKVEATRNKFYRALEYFGENTDSMQPHELFNIFCVFGRDFNKAKDEAFANMKKKMREDRKKAGRTQTPNSKHGRPPSVPERKPPPVPEHKTLRASSMQPHMNKVINDFKNPQRQNLGLAKQDEVPPTRTRFGERDQRGNDRHEKRIVPEDPGHQWTAREALQQYPDSSRNQQQVSRPMINAYGERPSRPEIPEVPVPRGMQESGRFEDASTPLYAQSTQQSAVSREASNSIYAQSTPQSAALREASAAESLRQKAKNRRQRQMQIVSGKTPVAATSSIQESRSPSTSPSAIEDDGNQVEAPNPQSSTHSRSSMRHRRLQAMKRVNASRNAGSSHSRSDWDMSSQVPTS